MWLNSHLADGHSELFCAFTELIQHYISQSGGIDEERFPEETMFMVKHKHGFP